MKMPNTALHHASDLERWAAIKVRDMQNVET